MLIDDANSLNEWLISVLEPICDADPQALAKYIMALIKKDKSQDDLKKICLESLEVFLVNETSSFVDLLFTTLNNRAYFISNSSSKTIDSQSQNQQQRQLTQQNNQQPNRSSSPKSHHRNVPAPSGSSRRYGNHQQIMTTNAPSHSPTSPNTKRRRSRSRSHGKSYKKNRSRSPSQQENHYTKTSSSRRCRDFDEKGFCIRGNLCTYDHGINPVIIDASNANSMLDLVSSVSSETLSAPNSATSVNQVRKILLSTPNNQSQYSLSSVGTGANEPYNPESPAIHTSRMNKNFDSLANDHSNNQQYRPTLHNSDDHRNGSNKNNFYLSAHDCNSDEQISMPHHKQNFHHNRSGQSRPFGKMHRHSHHNNHQIKQRKPTGSSGENSDKTTLEVRRIPSQLNTIANLNEHFSKFGTITNLKIGFDNDAEAALIQFSSNTQALAAYRSTEAVLNNRFIRVFWFNNNNNNNNNNSSNANSNQSINVGPVNQNTDLRSREAENSTEITDSNKKVSIRDRLGGIAEKQASIVNTAVNNLISSGLINSNTPNQLASLMTGSGANSSAIVNSHKLVSNKVTQATTQVSKPVFDPALLKKQYTPVSVANSSGSSVSSICSSSTTAGSTSTATNVSSLVSVSSNSSSNATSTTVNTTVKPLVATKSTTKLINHSSPISSINHKSSLLQPNKEKLMKKLELQKKRQEMLSTSIQQNRLLIEKLEKAKTDVERQAICETVSSLSKQIKQLEENIKRENSLIMEETNMQRQLSVS